MEKKYTDLGHSPEGYAVSAATDSAGPQVIVIDTSKPSSDSSRLHLLSQSLKDHAAAVALGNQIIEHGVDVYPDWFDFREPGTDLFALMFSMFSQRDKD